MPLASWFTQHWYGPAMGQAAISVSLTVSAGIKGRGTQAGSISAAASVPTADATRLKNSPATITTTSSISTASPKGRARPAATIKVNELSQADVAGAILDAQIDGAYSLKQVVRLMAAALAGKTSNSGQTFRDLSDTKDRITGTVSGGDRTAATYDPD